MHSTSLLNPTKTDNDNMCLEHDLFAVFYLVMTGASPVCKGYKAFTLLQIACKTMEAVEFY